MVDSIHRTWGRGKFITKATSVPENKNRMNLNMDDTPVL